MSISTNIVNFYKKILCLCTSTNVNFTPQIEIFSRVNYRTYGMSLMINTNFKQESPPAWTQEAYRPPCSEYSFCCPDRVPPPGRGTWPGTPPPPGGEGGTQTPPPGGYLTGYPTPPQGGYPDPPGGYLTGYPPGGSRSGTPPLWTDKHLWKQYLPVVLRTRAVMIHTTIVSDLGCGSTGCWVAWTRSAATRVSYLSLERISRTGFTSGTILVISEHTFWWTIDFNIYK